MKKTTWTCRVKVLTGMQTGPNSSAVTVVPAAGLLGRLKSPRYLTASLIVQHIQEALEGVFSFPSTNNLNFAHVRLVLAPVHRSWSSSQQSRSADMKARLLTFPEIIHGLQVHSAFSVARYGLAVGFRWYRHEQRKKAFRIFPFVLIFHFSSPGPPYTSIKYKVVWSGKKVDSQWRNARDQESWSGSQRNALFCRYSHFLLRGSIAFSSSNRWERQRYSCVLPNYLFWHIRLRNIK